jgi:NADH:ubiquinone oxidoreductase subunit H
MEEAIDAVEAAKRKAHAAARKFYGPNMTGPTGGMVDSARLVVIETMLAHLCAERSSYVGNQPNVVAALELRDYWEAVAEEVAKR